MRVPFASGSWGKRARLREPEYVLAELKYVADNAPASTLSICNSTFDLNKAHTEIILTEMMRRGLHKKLQWDCTTRIDIVDDDFLRLVRKAGCTTIGFGIESGSDRFLNSTGKNITVEKSIKTAQSARKLGFKTVGYFIFGHKDFEADMEA